MELTQINSLSITTSWSAPSTVTDVVLQYRLTESQAWINGSVIPYSRGLYVLSGLEPVTTYELRTVFGEEDGVEYTSEMVVTTCEEGFAGETACDTGRSMDCVYSLSISLEYWKTKTA